jgi:Fe-S-cluster containining protein
MSDSNEDANLVSADIDLAIGKRRLQTRLSIPVVPTPSAALLPLVRGIADAAVVAACEDANALGTPVSCRAGCAFCCRHLVPVTAVEARRIRELIEEMPEPQRSAIRARFASARIRLEEEGLLADLHNPSAWNEATPPPRTDDYFHLGIPCPFLEDEACSIYPERPLVCREYMVVSPPERCTDPRSREVLVVKLPFDTWRALARTANPEPGRPVRWVPLILAPEWADAHPESPPTQTGTDLVRRLFAELTGKEIPAPPGQEPPCPSLG